MAEITINGVKYTNVPNKKAGTKFAASLTQSNIGASQAVQDYVNSAYFYPLVNAIDINWNGVEVEENSYINTTSDLISYIASKESNIDLSSYATMAYVDQKITDLIGGAPETLDTLKELADALADDASLAYVTQALDGKADKSSLTNYATNSYVTTELDKKANKSDIVQADMCETDTTSKSYVLNNPYQYHVKSLYGTDYNCYNLVIPHNAKQQFFSDFTLSTLVIGDDHYINASYGIIQGKGNRINTICEVAFGKYNECNTSSNSTIFTVGNGTNSANKHNAFAIRKDGTIYIADTEDGTPYSLQTKLNSKADANNVYTKTEVNNLIPAPVDLSSYVTISYVTTELDKKADKTQLPDMTQYVSVSSYNALYEEVQHLAYLISYYHSTPEPEPEPITGEFYYENYYTDVSLGSTITPVIVNTYPYTNITYTGNDNSIFTVDSNGTCTGEGIGTANLTAELYDDNNNLVTSSTSLVTVAKMMPVAYWSFNGTALPDNELVALQIGQYQSQFTYTFSSTPASGWSFGQNPISGVNVDETTYDITIDPSSLTDTGIGRVQVDYNEDATYQQKSYSIEFRVLAQGEDTEFFFRDKEVHMSQNYTTTTSHLCDKSGLMEQGYTPTFTIGNQSYVSVAQQSDNPNEIEFTWLAEGETTVTATITDGNETHSATITVYCQWDRDWVDGHVYTSQNNEVNYEYGIIHSGSNPSLTFTASNGNTQDPMNGDLFEVSISNDTNNIISYTSTSSGLTISFGNGGSVGDEINVTIIKQQDTTYGYYTKDLRFKVVPNGSDPLLWWENGALFNVTENDVFSQDPITNWLNNQIIDFSTWQPLTPTLSITNGDGAAHLDQDNVLHGDSAGYCNLAATVTDLNNNTHTGSAIINVVAAS